MRHGYFLVREHLYCHIIMANEMIEYGLIAALVALLLTAVVSDLRHRIIENWLTIAVAALAPLYWLATDMPVWPDMAIQLSVGLVTFLFFMIFFALGQFGGGDLKLLGALGLWLPAVPMIRTLLVMSIVGGVLTVITYLWHKRSKREGAVETPYGVAIAIAGLLAITQRYLNHFV